MRASLPSSSKPLFINTRPPSQHAPPAPPQHITAIASSLRQHTQQLNTLYTLTASRNQRLLQLSLDLSRDLRFLKDYCSSLEQQLQRRGFYGEKEFDRLSRKQTAASIFDCYTEGWDLLDGLKDAEPPQSDPLNPHSLNLNMQTDHYQYYPKHQTNSSKQPLKLHQGVQVSILDPQQLLFNSNAAETKINKLSQEVRQLKRSNEELEFQKHKRQTNNWVFLHRQQVFSKIHAIIGEYRKKVSELAVEKSDFQRKYRMLKEKIQLTETGSQLKLMNMLTEKVQILQRLTEKQQTEIQKTIDLYEAELQKIEHKRKEELDYFQNQRIGLQNQNLQLCMDLQKTLNRQDSHNLLLMQERNRTEILRREVNKMTQDVALLEIKDKTLKQQKLKIYTSLVKFYGEGFLTAQKESEIQGKLSCHSAGYRPFDQNSNTSNYEYQYSEMEEGPPFLRRVEIQPKLQNREKSFIKQKETIEKINISYGNPFDASYSRKIEDKSQQSVSSFLRRGCQSVVQYKRRFVERKPDNSFKQ